MRCVPSGPGRNLGMPIGSLSEISGSCHFGLGFLLSNSSVEWWLPATACGRFDTVWQHWRKLPLSRDTASRRRSHAPAPICESKSARLCTMSCKCSMVVSVAVYRYSKSWKHSHKDLNCLKARRGLTTHLVSGTRRKCACLVWLQGSLRLGRGSSPNGAFSLY